MMMPRLKPGAVLPIACLLALGGCSGEATTDELAQPDIYTVGRGDLRITVREQGEIKALRENRVRSEVEGQATIIFLVPEGSRVDQGDKLVELDASSLEDREATQAITVERAQAALVNSEQNVEILEKELQAEQASARSKLEIAQIALEKFLGKATPTQPAQVQAPKTDDGGGNVQGSGSNRSMLIALNELVKDTEHAGLTKTIVDLIGEDNLDRDLGNGAQQVLNQIDQIRLARADLKLKEDTLGHSKRLAAKDYITGSELDTNQLAYDRQESQVSLSWNQLELLINYELKSEKIELELNVDNAQLEVDKVVASAEARRARVAAELKSSQSEFDLADERLDNLRKQINNAVIYAPNPGLVVYAQVGDGRRSREVVEEGMSVRERQSLIILPDVSTMIAELKVPEADIDKVVRGQSALVDVDTFPERPFQARVTRVSPLPDSGSRWSNNNKKVYKTEVTLEGENTVLRPGMSATVEILVGRIRDVLNVPLQAVRRQGAVHYVWKVDPTAGPTAQLVKVGRNNLTHVEILEGIGEGERVYLSPPTMVQAPEFEQPESNEDEPEPPPIGQKPKRPTEQPHGDSPGAGQRGDGERRGRRRGGSSPELKAFLQRVKTKLPQFADALNGGMGALFSNQELKDAISADPELSAERDKLMSSFRRGGGGGRGR